MLREPEYFLRYRLAPSDIRRSFWAIALLVTGTILLSISKAILWRNIGGIRWAALLVGAYGMGWIFGLTIPALIVVKYTLDIPWPRILFYVSMVWFLVNALVFAVVIS